jgi:hypothetical protein
VQKAPHCVRNPDASAPAPFDVGLDASPPTTGLPRVLFAGGPVLEAPTFVSVTFPGDPLADELDDFVASVGCTDYWRTIGADYGVGDAVAAPPVRMTSSPPSTLDDSDLRAGLAAAIDSGTLPHPSPETIYALFYPSTTTITLNGATSCVDFGGYHGEGTLGDGTPFFYTVLAHCTDDMTKVTPSAVHELIEAATDPRWMTQPAYLFTDSNHPGPAFGYGTEVGDMCEDQRIFQPAGFPWFVQRVWSNRSASLGEDPCLPAPSTDYAYAVIDPSDTFVTSVLTGSPTTVPVVHVPVDTSVTVPVKIFANYSPVQLIFSYFELSADVTVSWTASTVQPGDTIMVTIHKSSPGIDGASAFALETVDGATFSDFWILTSD